MLTASKSFGRWTTRFGLFAVPEEVRMPRILSPLVPHAARRWRRRATAPFHRDTTVQSQALVDSHT
jgi:membrane glycosyltransferase